MPRAHAPRPSSRSVLSGASPTGALTLPSSGRAKGCALVPPLKSNVRRRELHGRRSRELSRRARVLELREGSCRSAQIRSASWKAYKGSPLVAAFEQQHWLCLLLSPSGLTPCSHALPLRAGCPSRFAGGPLTGKSSGKNNCNALFLCHRASAKAVVRRAPALKTAGLRHNQTNESYVFRCSERKNSSTQRAAALLTARDA